MLSYLKMDVLCCLLHSAFARKMLYSFLTCLIRGTYLAKVFLPWLHNTATCVSVTLISSTILTLQLARRIHPVEHMAAVSSNGTLAAANISERPKNAIISGSGKCWVTQQRWLRNFHEYSRVVRWMYYVLKISIIWVSRRQKNRK